MSLRYFGHSSSHIAFRNDCILSSYKYQHFVYFSQKAVIFFTS